MSGITEEAAGISEHSTDSPSFRAVTKQRFSDFIVHEIDTKGTVTMLSSLVYEKPAAPGALPPAELQAALATALGDEIASAALALEREQQPDGARELQLPRDDDKDRRRAQHQLVKQHLPGLVSDTLDLPDGGKCVRLQRKRDAQRAAKQEQSAWAAGRGGRGGGKRRRVDDRDDWAAEGGDNKYLCFTLYKENRDTIDATVQLARGLHVSSNIFSFAGTKDRRAVTTQRVTAFKLPALKLADFMAKLPFGDSILAGDFAYVAAPLRLGDHNGNRFTITLRDVSCGEAELDHALAQLARRGFINYFGLQRFGTNSEAPSHLTGAALLRADWTEALRLLLAHRDNEREDEKHARDLWAETRDPAAVLQVMPRRMASERSVLEGLRQHGVNNVLTAFSRLPRTLKGMYLHSFQSYLWNHAASHRVRLFGVERVIAGDLVLRLRPDTASSTHPAGVPATDEREDGGRGREGVGDGGGEGGEGVDDVGDDVADVRECDVHVVTEAEAEAATFSIDDVVLPMPGHRVCLPRNGIDETYRTLLQQHGLSMESFDNRIKEHALPGTPPRPLSLQPTLLLRN